VYSQTYQRTVEGQALDINLRGDEAFTLEKYFQIVQLKTALLPDVQPGGRRPGGRHPGEAHRVPVGAGPLPGAGLPDPGRHHRPDRGKGRGGEVGCDIREGKPSIFFAHVLDRKLGTAEERRQLIEIVRRSREETSPADVAWAIDFYRRIGALEFAQGEARRLIDRAFLVVDGLPMEEAHRELFRAIGRFMIDRNT